jgi:TPR repeat protein
MKVLLGYPAPTQPTQANRISRDKPMNAEKTKDVRRILENACDLFESGERTTSIKLFLKAASMGNVEAQVNLANIYDEGDGIKSNFDKARYWYKRAISAGSPEGAYNLGMSYLNRGDVRWSKHWLNVAKAMGDEDASEQLNK